MAGHYREKMGLRIKEGKLEIKLAGRGREQSRRVFFKARGLYAKKGMVLWTKRHVN